MNDNTRFDAHAESSATPLPPPPPIMRKANGMEQFTRLTVIQSLRVKMFSLIAGLAERRFTSPLPNRGEQIKNKNFLK